MALFKGRHGIIPACDVAELTVLEELVRETSDLEFVQGYKIGILTVLPNGLVAAVQAIRKYSELPVIYDHQKFGTDIPEICGGQILKTVKDTGVDGLIIFPQAGIETLKATVSTCLRVGLTPLVGGEMTHKGYLTGEGGYIEDGAPARIYADAAKCGVEYYVVPGTRVEAMTRYKGLLERSVKAPKFLFPGVGSGQGGDVRRAFDAVKPHSGYAIVGRGIYASPDKRTSAMNLWKEVDYP